MQHTYVRKKTNSTIQRESLYKNLHMYTTQSNLTAKNRIAIRGKCETESIPEKLRVRRSEVTCHF